MKRGLREKFNEWQDQVRPGIGTTIAGIGLMLIAIIYAIDFVRFLMFR